MHKKGKQNEFISKQKGFMGFLVIGLVTITWKMLKKSQIKLTIKLRQYLLNLL
jgi:hypothetical protein